MTTEVKVESILEKIEDLSIADLLTLQEHITSLLRQKMSNGNGNGSAIADDNGHKQEAQSETASNEDNEPDKIYPYPGYNVYRYTPKGARKALEAMFGTERLAELEKVDVSNLPKLDKTVTEYIDELREERM